jgi:hypothetical protein
MFIFVLKRFFSDSKDVDASTNKLLRNFLWQKNKAKNIGQLCDSGNKDKTTKVYSRRIDATRTLFAPEHH